MKYWLLAFLFIIIPCHADALDVPQLKGRVNDYASILSPETIQKLDATLSALEISNSTQVVVLTIPSLEVEVLEDFSIKVAEAWKIGQKNLDNGAILIVSKNDRKIRIEVGRGLEGKLTDLCPEELFAMRLFPNSKKVTLTAESKPASMPLYSVVKGEYAASRPNNGRKESGRTPIFALLIFLFVITAALSNFSKILGGITGAIILPVISLISFAGISLLLLGILAIAGFAFGLFAGAVTGGAGRHYPGGFIGGGFGGGGFGGGGFGGGGFSGGGGGFGGGGSSGGW